MDENKYYSQVLDMVGLTLEGVDFRPNFWVETSRGNRLYCSEFSPSNPSGTGYVYVQGLGAPRETGFEIATKLSKEGHRVFLYDQQGYGSSSGKPFQKEWEDDIVEVGREYRSQQGLENLICLGHSLGGTNALIASGREDYPYGATIAFGSPIAPSDEVRKKLSSFSYHLLKWLPRGNSIIAKKLCAFNQQRADENPLFSDFIARRYLPFCDGGGSEIDFGAFMKNPRYLAMNCANSIEDFVSLLWNFPSIAENYHSTGNEHLIYAGDDQHIGVVNNKLPEHYCQTLCGDCGVPEKNIAVIANLSHRFIPSEKEEIHLIGHRDNSLVEEILNRS
ncbi:MAG: alpha/beta hydrolase [Nanoarchaeota archaeon]